MAKTTYITEVPDWNSLQKCRVLCLNRYKVNVYGITGHWTSETEFTYHLYTEQRITKGGLALVQAYIKRIVDTLRSF